MVRWFSDPIPWLIVIAVILVGFGVAWGSTLTRMSTIETTQKSLVEIARAVPVMQRDIEWIRKDMEKRGDK